MSRHQEIEIAAAVGLEHGFLEQAGIAAVGQCRRRKSCARLAPAGEFAVLDQEIKAPARHVEANPVARLDQAQGPPTPASGATCSTIVPKAVPLMRASEIHTMSLTPRSASFSGMGR